MLNDDIIAYLKAKGIVFSGGEYQTGIPEGGHDQIIQWDETKLGPQPTQAELDVAGQQAQAETTKAENKAQATALLKATDWVEMPSVSDPTYTPHLLNKGTFMVYRAALRAIAVNPPSDPAVFPTAPSEDWSS